MRELGEYIANPPCCDDVKQEIPVDHRSNQRQHGLIVDFAVSKRRRQKQPDIERGLRCRAAAARVPRSSVSARARRGHAG